MKSRTAAAIVLVAIIGIAASLWLATERQPQPAQPTASPSSEPAPAAQIPPESAQATSATVPATPPIPVWESKIDQVLRSNVTELQTAQILINMLPTLPEEGQVEAANHISNLLADEDYDKVKPLLLNPTTPESVLSVFFTDTMNRADSVKLRAFLDITKISNHPFHEEALSDLQIFLGNDYGGDWLKWSAALEGYLKTSAAK